MSVTALDAARTPRRAQAEGYGVEVGHQAVGEGAQPVAFVRAGIGDPLGQPVRAADHHSRRRGDGWHYHPGDVLAVVEQGELTHVDAQGASHVYRRGDAFLEPRGN